MLLNYLLEVSLFRYNLPTNYLSYKKCNSLFNIIFRFSLLLFLLYINML